MHLNNFINLFHFYFLANGNYANNNNNAQTAAVDMNANTEKSTTLAAGQSSAATIASTAATTNNNNTQPQSGNVNNNLNGQQPKAQRNPLRGNANRGKSSKSNQVSDTVKNEKLVNGSS